MGGQLISGDLRGLNPDPPTPLPVVETGEDTTVIVLKIASLFRERAKWPEKRTDSEGRESGNHVIRLVGTIRVHILVARERQFPVLGPCHAFRSRRTLLFSA